jgi:hypothetical protein
MTETQAKSGNKGTSANPVDEEAAKGGTAATGRAAVGRATVPGDAPATPKFTRAPGMAPPPDKPGEGSGASDQTEKAPAESPTSVAAPTVVPPAATTTQPIKPTGTAKPSTGTTGTQPRVGAGLGTAPKPTAVACRRASAERPPSGRPGWARRYVPRAARSARPRRADPAGPG